VVWERVDNELSSERSGFWTSRGLNMLEGVLKLAVIMALEGLLVVIFALTIIESMATNIS